MSVFTIDYRGEKHLIVFSEDAVSDVREHAQDRNLLDRLARYNELAKTLANSGRIASQDDFVNEDDGFFAIKATPIRAYGWWDSWIEKSGLKRSCFVVSHIVVKRQNKLAASDKAKMKRIRNQYLNFSNAN